MQHQGPYISRYINELIRSYGCDEKSPVIIYLRLLQQHMAAIGGSMAVYRVLELVASAPDRLAKEFLDGIDQLKVSYYDNAWQL